jgi:heptosyltransferase-3
MLNNQTLVFSAYGKDPLYHQGVVFNYLKTQAKGFIPTECRVVVYTDKPDFYKDFPLGIHDISPMVNEWTLDGRYHFRIKNLVLQNALKSYGGKIIHLDSDILIKKNLDTFLDLISNKSAVLYLNEGSVLKKKKAYFNLINSNSSEFLKYHTDLNSINMYGSAVIGINQSMLSTVEQADLLIKDWLDKVDAHTVEQFALSEALIWSGVAITPVASMTTSYSTSGSKAYARERIEEFFNFTKNMEFKDKLISAKNWPIRRPFGVWLKQKLGLC